MNHVAVAVGFYIDANGNSQGYIYNSPSASFTRIGKIFGAVSTQAAGINDSGRICGSFTDTGGVTHGFFGMPGHFAKVDIPTASATVFTGCNNTGFLAGFVTIGGVAEGVIYNTANKTSQIIKDPQQSATAAFGVNGTTINGINDKNQIVGFYSDGTKVHGFWAIP